MYKRQLGPFHTRGKALFLCNKDVTFVEERIVKTGSTTGTSYKITEKRMILKNLINEKKNNLPVLQVR